MPKKEVEKWRVSELTEDKDIVIKVDKPYFGGTLRSGKNIQIEIPKTKTMYFRAQKRMARNPARVNVTSFKMGAHEVNLCYYQDSGKFAMYVNWCRYKDYTIIPKDIMLHVLTYILYICKHGKKPKGFALERAKKQVLELVERM